MARSITTPLVLPDLYSIGRQPIVESRLQAIRDALVTLYEEHTGGLVADYHPAGLTDGTAASLYYRIKIQKNEQSTSFYPQLRIVVWVTNANAAAKNVTVTLEGVTSTLVSVPGTTAAITAFYSDIEWGETTDELVVGCQADVTIYGVSVYDYRSRASLDAGVYANGIACPDSDTWDAEKPCSVGHYLDLVALARHTAGREAGQILATCRQAGTLLTYAPILVHLPLSSRPGGETLQSTWRVIGPGTCRVMQSGAGYTDVTSTAAYGTWGDAVQVPIYVPQDAVERPARATLDLLILGDVQGVSAYWSSAPSIDGLTGPSYLGTPTDTVITETGARILVA